MTEPVKEEQVFYTVKGKSGELVGEKRVCGLMNRGIGYRYSPRLFTFEEDAVDYSHSGDKIVKVKLMEVK